MYQSTNKYNWDTKKRLMKLSANSLKKCLNLQASYNPNLYKLLVKQKQTNQNSYKEVLPDTTGKNH